MRAACPLLSPCLQCGASSPGRAAGWINRKSNLRCTAALLTSPWKKADVPSSWHLYFCLEQRWIWLSCLLLFPALGECCGALLKMRLAGCKLLLLRVLGDRGGEGLLPSASLCDALLHFLLPFTHPFTSLQLFAFFFLYLFKATWVNREQEHGNRGCWYSWI